MKYLFYIYMRVCVKLNIKITLHFLGKIIANHRLMHKAVDLYLYIFIYIHIYI